MLNSLRAVSLLVLLIASTFNAVPLQAEECTEMACGYAAGWACVNNNIELCGEGWRCLYINWCVCDEYDECECEAHCEQG
jgi:hypothetical protein